MSREPSKHYSPTPLDEALGRHCEELKKLFPLPSPKPKPRKPIKAAGTALLLAVAAGVLAWLNPAYKSESFSTAIGERRAIILDDGSELLLDSGSQVDISWHVRTRQVALRSGQALFDVSEALYRPFVVSAGSTRVRVLGTQFNVRRLDDDNVRVTLARGRVEVDGASAAQSPVFLTPGQQVDSMRGQLQPVAQVSASTAMAWKDDRIVFEQTPLGEALSLLRQYRRSPVFLSDTSLASLKVTGVFEAHNTDLLLDLLPTILPVAVIRQADGAVQIQRRPTRK